MTKETTAEKNERKKLELETRKEKERLEKEDFEKNLPAHMFNMMVAMAKLAEENNIYMNIGLEVTEAHGVIVNFDFNCNYDRIYISTKDLEEWEIEQPIRELEHVISQEKEVRRKAEVRNVALAKLTKEEKELLGLK